MKKLFIAVSVVLGVIALLLGGALIFLGLRLDTIVRQSVEREGSAITQTAVKLREVEMSPLSGEGTIRGLSIANPEGFSSKNVLEVGSIEVSLDPWSVFDDDGPIMIHEVVVHEAVVNFEIRRRATNVGTLKRNIAGVLERAEEEPSAEEGRKVIVERVLLSKTKVNIVIGGKRRTVQRSIRIPDIELHDIGEVTNGVLAREALRQVFGALAREVKARVRRTRGPWQGLLEKIRQGRRERGKAGGLRERVRERVRGGEAPDGGPGGLRERVRERVRERRGE